MVMVFESSYCVLYMFLLDCLLIVEVILVEVIGFIDQFDLFQLGDQVNDIIGLLEIVWIYLNGLWCDVLLWCREVMWLGDVLIGLVIIVEVNVIIVVDDGWQVMMMEIGYLFV